MISFINYFTSIFFSVFSIAISFILLKKISKIKIETFYWFLSFLLSAVSFIMYFISELKEHHSFQAAFLLHTNETLILWLKLYVSLKTFSVLKGINVFTFSIYKLFLYLFFFFLVLISPILMHHPQKIELTGLQGLQIIGIKKLDIFFDFSQLILSFTSFLLLSYYKNIKFFKYAFLLTFLSKLLQILNIYLFEYRNEILYLVEWTQINIVIVLFFIGVFKNFIDKRKIIKMPLTRKIL